MSRSPQPERLARFACHDRCQPDPARRSHHDRLLTVETDADAVVELFDLAVTWGELEHPTGELVPPAAWMEFAGRHRWRDPVRVERIFLLATDIAMRTVPAAPPLERLGIAAGSGLCPALVPPRRRPPSLTVAGR